MRECRVIVPTHNNVGNALPYEHQEFQLALCRVFGGYTKTLGFGGWTDGKGNIVEEEIAIYDVAIDEVMEGSDKLRDHARALGVRTQQEAIYFRNVDGTVEFLTV